MSHWADQVGSPEPRYPSRQLPETSCYGHQEDWFQAKVSVDLIETELVRILWSWNHWMTTNDLSLLRLHPELHAEMGALRRLIETIQQMLLKDQFRK